MSSILALLVWLTILGLAAWRPGLGRRFGNRIVPLGALLALGLSPFWREVLCAPWTGDGPLLAGPEVAFASVWILVLAALARRRLDGDTVAASLYTGLLAAAAVSMAIDGGNLIFGQLPVGSLPGFLVTATILAVVILLLLAGFTLRLLATPGRFPWDYAPWSAGLLIVAQPAHPALLALAPGARHGLWTVALAFIACGCLWFSLRAPRRQAMCWIGGAFLAPLVAGGLAIR
jgi:hypothetical protein